MADFDGILKIYDFERKDLNLKCQRNIRDKIANEIIGDWYLVGRSLDVSDAKLNCIIHDNVTYASPEEKAVVLLDAWAAEYGSKATCLKLAEALFSRSKVHTIEILCAEVKRDSTASAPSTSDAVSKAHQIQNNQQQQGGELSRHGGGRVVDSTPLAAGSNQSQTPADNEIIRSNKEEIRAEFSDLLLIVQKELESEKVSIPDVRRFLINFFENDVSTSFLSATTFDDIFLAMKLNRLWDYQHYSPLEKFTNRLLPNNQAVTSSIANYKAKLTGFLLVTKIIPYMRMQGLEEVAEQQSSLKPLKPEYYRKITFVLSLGRRVSQLSLDYVQKLWMSVAEEYELPCLTTIIERITSGSLKITWLVLPSVVNRLSVRAKFFKKEMIVQVLVDDVIFYDEKEMAGHERKMLKLFQEGKADATQVSHLLQKGVDPDVHDENGRHPLWYASYRGRTDLVELLLKSDASVNLATENEFGETALIAAVNQGRLTTAALLLDHGADVNKQNKKGQSPLWSASYNGKDDLVLLLLEHKAQIDLPNDDEHGETALIAAVNQGRLSTAALLLDHGADVNKQNKKRQSPLWTASYKGNDDLVLLLLAHKAEIDLPTDDEIGETALIAAVNQGRLTTAALLLLFGADVNKQNKKGQFPLWSASYKGKDDLVVLLLEHKAEIDLPSDEELGETALIAASGQGRLTTAALLLLFGADVNKQKKTGTTPLYFASKDGHAELVELFLKKGAHVNQGTDPPLYAASLNGRVDIVKRLIRHGADVNLPTQDEEFGSTPLGTACEKNHLEVVTVLIENGAVVDSTNKKGMSPLHFASDRGNTDVVNLLLKYHAQIEIKNNEGRTALMIASWRGHLKIVKVLLGAGAETDVQDQEGLTSLMLATKNGHTDVVKVLLEAKADPNPREKNSGWSALFFSSQGGHLKMAELLIAAGAVVDRKDKDDATAYVIAEVNGHSDLCELLEKHSRLQRETETAVTEEQHKQVKKSYQRLLKIFDILEDTLLKGRKEKRLHQANQRNVSALADVNEN